MTTDLSIDPELLAEALKVSGERSESAVVPKALQEFVALRRQKRLLDLMGELEWEPCYDYKKGRMRKA
jgi:Arc/MetJ family transcription regulator